MHTAVTFAQKLSADGFAIVPGVVNTKEIADLIVGLENLGEINSIRKRGKIFAVRNLLDVAPEVSALLKAPYVCEIVRSALDSQAFPVRGIPFDKTPNANWKVPWHQDLTIAVAEKKQREGFAPGPQEPGLFMSSHQPMCSKTCFLSASISIHAEQTVAY